MFHRLDEGQLGVRRVNESFLGHRCKAARLAQEVSSWGQCVQMPWRVFTQRIENGSYARPAKGARMAEIRAFQPNGS